MCPTRFCAQPVPVLNPCESPSHGLRAVITRPAALAKAGMPVYFWEGYPADIIGNAVKIMRIATGEEEVNIPDDGKSRKQLFQTEALPIRDGP